MHNNNYMVFLDNINKRYRTQDAAVLTNISLAVEKGESVAILGPSGSGKSTLLHIIGLLDDYDCGNLMINSVDVSRCSDSQKTNIRLRNIGFIYQYHHLLQEFTALENVMLPQLIAGVSRKAASQASVDLLRNVGLDQSADCLPSELSGGQRQRVAFARALANSPSIFLADEPTGNLDPENANAVFLEIISLTKKNQMTSIIATHNYDLAKKMDSIYVFSDGALVKK